MQSDPHANPVHSMLERLSRAVGEGASTLQGAIAERGYTGLLVKSIRQLRLSATARQLAEAQPYLETIAGFDEFRTVLLRLGLEATHVDVAATALKAQHIPCLLCPEDGGTPWLITGINDSGHYQVVDEAEALPRQKAKGKVYLLTKVDRVRQEAVRQRDGWVGPVLASFLPSIKQLLGVSLLLSISGICASLLVMAIYDFAIAARALDTLVMLVLGAAGLMVFEITLRRYRSRGIAQLSARFDALVAVASYQQVLALPLPSTDSARLSTQLARLRQFQIGRTLFSGPLAAAMLDLPFTVVSFGVLFAIAGPLAFAAVGLAVVFGLGIIALAPVMAARMRETGELKAQADAILIEIATKMSTVRATATEDVQHKRALASYADYLLSRHRSQALEASVQTATHALMNFAGAAVLFLGALRVMNDALTIGALSAIMIIVWRVLSPIQTVASSVFRVKQATQILAQIDQLMRLKTERPSMPRLSGTACAIEGHIALKNVTFRYSGRPDFALKQVALDIPRGQFVAVTGPSGAGKSTLLKAALGLYQPQMGGITVDGADLRHLDMADYRQAISYLPQETRIFYGTVAQNVRLCVPEATNQEIMEALALMGLPMPGPGFPEGISTRLRGRGDSRGAAAIHQRIALATVLVARRPLVLLDTPGQHLDHATDKALIAALSFMKRRSTIVMATQRPSHMQLADTVVLLREGAIAAMGPPEKLVPLIMTEMKAAAAATLHRSA